MTNKRLSIIIFLALIANIKLLAQKDSTTIEFDASIRERIELWDGMNAKNYGDDNPDAIGSLHDKTLYQRVIAGFIFHPTTSIDVVAHLQDSRAFGWSLRNAKYPDLFKVKAKNTQEPYYTMNPNEEFFEIHDLYIEYRNLIKNLTFILGRQKISYGDNRVFGPGEWGNTGRWTWDAFKISYKNKSNFIDIIAGGTKIHDPEKISLPFTKTEFWGSGLYAHFEWNKIANIEPFYVIKREGSAPYANTLDFTRQWIGVRLFNNDFHHFLYDFTVNKEFGNESSKKIDASGILAKLGYQFHTMPAKPILAVRESYASGGKNADSKIKTFDPVYGSKDQYYGRMNITSWSNLDDREIFVTLFPVKNMKIESNYHWFYVPVPDDVTLLGTIKMQTGKHHLGNEFDIFASYQAAKHMQFVAAFGLFSPGDIKPINNAPAKNASWFAFQIFYQFTSKNI
jgi:hypothetical protein